MSAIRARLVEAAQSGQLEIAFNETIDGIDRALREGNTGLYTRQVKSESDGSALVARLKSEDIVACVSGGQVTLELAQFVEGTSTRVRLVMLSEWVDTPIVGKFMNWISHLHPTMVGGAIEFVLPAFFEDTIYTFRPMRGCSFASTVQSGGSHDVMAALERAGFTCVHIQHGCIHFHVPASVHRF